MTNNPKAETMNLESDRLTDHEVLELGREVLNDSTLNSFERQGRPLTNTEMDAVRVYRADQRRKAHEILRAL